MTTVAILPVKSFAAAKQRLGDALAPDARRALVEAMLADVLDGLGGAGSIDQVLIVTQEPGAARIAARHGATVIENRDAGHNAAAERGVRHGLASGADCILLVPGDCPLLRPGELDALVAHDVGPRSALIVPDRHGTGTNALLLTPPDSLAPSFGPGSCRQHASNARAAGLVHEIVEIPSLALDVDTPDDLTALRAALAATRGGAQQTRGVLARRAAAAPC